MSRAGHAHASFLLVLASMIGCKGDHARSDQRGAGPIAVEVEAIERGTIQQSLRYPGELAAPESVELASKVAGRLRTIRVNMGDPVKRGAILADIDDVELRAQLEEARAAADVAQASVRRAEVEDKNAAQELARKEPLAKQDLVTRQELDNVRTRRDSAAASLQVARAQVSQAQARSAVLRQQLRDAKIVAPFAGWIAARHLDGGTVLSPGTAILSLVRTDPIVVRFQVPERDVGEIRQKMSSGSLPVTLEVDAYRTERFSGKVVRVAPSLDAASRAAPVEAEVSNQDGRLMPGMYGRIELDLGEATDVLVVPLRALLEGTRESADDARRGGPREGSLFVVTDGRAERVTVSLGREHGDLGEIVSGLEQGALVVVQGQSSLTDGAAVEIVTIHDGETEPETEAPEPAAEVRQAP